MKHEGNGDIVVVALGTVPKNLEKRLDELQIRRRIETIQTTSLLRLVRLYFMAYQPLLII